MTRFPPLYSQQEIDAMSRRPHPLKILLWGTALTYCVLLAIMLWAAL